MSVFETVSKVEERDPATALLLVRMAMYDALCTEADLVGPDLDADVRKSLVEKAAQGLKHLARQPVTAETIAVADHLAVLVSKDTDDDKKTPWWDARNAKGEFRLGTARQNIAGAMDFATSTQGSIREKTKQTRESLGGEDAKYNRLRFLGRGLIATGDPNASAAGTIMSLIGDIGPEAQKALEPGIRRSAYRYRGTERRPDGRTQAQVRQMVDQLQGPGQDSDRLKVTKTVGVGYLLPKVPDVELAKISLEAGKMPPSIGLMFDGQGHLVSEAQGFNGDHYLPFDLKNLKRLKGGSYVRTRTTGGLTDEDIYTGLMTGAREVTVVSNSGVFTLEFDPSMRGGRRYSDKARQMVDRYSRLVAAIDSEKLQKTPLPAAQVRQIRDQAFKDSRGNAAQAQDLFRTRRQAAEDAASFTGKDDDELMDEAEATVRAQGTSGGTGTFPSKVKEEFNRLRAEQSETTAQKYRLDGEGYRAAQKTLMQEFPFFIRKAPMAPLPEYIAAHNLEQGQPRRKRGGHDIGYTTRGGLDAKHAGSLGAPAGKQKAKTDSKEISADEQGERLGFNAPAPGESAPAAAGLQTMVAAALEDKRPALTSALTRTLRAVKSVGADWPLAEKGLDDQGALREVGATYAEWLSQKGPANDQAKFLLGAPAEHLSKTLEALDDVQATLKQYGEAQGYSDADFDEARTVVQTLLRLKKPFSPSNPNPFKAPEENLPAPMAFEDIVGMDVSSPDTMLAWGSVEGNQDAHKLAERWLDDDRTDVEIAELVTEKAKVTRRVKAWADAGMDPNQVPAGADIDDDDFVDDAKKYQEMGEDSPLFRELSDMNRAWSVLRLHQVVGATRGTGAAVPFAKGVRAPGSTPSRLVRHSPDSPLVQAVHKRLLAQSAKQRRPQGSR